MKKLSFLALAVVGLLLGACSDKDDEVKAVQGGEDFKDGAFIGLSLQLPSADNTTRADDTGNDVFSNGEEDEFAVKNATLYIFKLAKNSTDDPDVAATYVDNVSLGNSYDPDTQGGIDPDEWGKQDGVDATNITSTYNKATRIPNELASTMKSDTENQYFAYVILNHNGQVNVVADMTFKAFCDQEFTQIGAEIAAEKNIFESGLVMTNAPICDKSGGLAAPATGAKYTTLVPLDNTMIFGSASEAESSPAACVYVERAAVKITVVDGRTETTLQGIDVTILGWQVINTEPSYYNTRHINSSGVIAADVFAFEDWGPYNNENAPTSSTKYRFVSVNPFTPTLPGSTGHTFGHRTYFGFDPQYNAAATLNYTVASEDRDWITVGPQKHAYTTENTFDVANQTWRNTTMVTLKVRIGAEGNDGFYTVGKGSQVMYVDDADMTAAGAKTGIEKAKAAIENIVKGDNDVASALTALRNEVSKNKLTTNVKSGLTVTFTAPSAATTDVRFTITPDYTVDNVAYSAFNVGDEAALKGDLEKAIKAVIYSDYDPEATVEQDVDDLTTADEVLLSFYKGGIAYYNARIQHFGEAETPWSPTLSAALETANAGSGYIYGGGANVNEIYFGVDKDENPTAEQITLAQNRFLGRYGVVRDNWYKLSIDKIAKIGTAEPVDPSTTTPDTPDDEIENYLSVHVHILPWVLRSQSVNF